MHRDPVCISLLHPIIFPREMLSLYSIFKAAIFFLTFYSNILPFFLVLFFNITFIYTFHPITFSLFFEGTNLTLFFLSVSFYVLKVLIHFILFLLFYRRT